MPEISIIVPVYKVEKYLANCIKSIIAQTYKDFELILVDDGSPDNCPAMCDEYAKKYDFIKVIHKENGGLADARNVGLANASGKFIVFVDSDDVISDKYLERLFNDAEKNNSDVVIGSYKRVNEEHLFDFSPTFDGETIDKKSLMKLMLSRSKFDAYCGCFLIKKDLLSKYGISFNKDVKFSVDQAFMWNVVDVADRITINYSKIYNYYLRPESIMTSSTMEKILSGLNHYEKTIKSLKNLPYKPEIVINRWKLGILHSSAKLCTYNQFLEIIEKFNISFKECIKIPLVKIKILSLIGLLSKKALYNVFRKR